MDQLLHLSMRRTALDCSSSCSSDCDCCCSDSCFSSSDFSASAQDVRFCFFSCTPAFSVFLGATFEAVLAFLAGEALVVAALRFGAAVRVSLWV